MEVRRSAASEAVIAVSKHSFELNVSPIWTNCSELCVHRYLPILKRCVFFLPSAIAVALTTALVCTRASHCDKSAVIFRLSNQRCHHDPTSGLNPNELLWAVFLRSILPTFPPPLLRSASARFDERESESFDQSDVPKAPHRSACSVQLAAWPVR